MAGGELVLVKEPRALMGLAATLPAVLLLSEGDGQLTSRA
jgi:hypothetical protein